jgi:hypothetical protein
VRASDEHCFIVRVLRAQGLPPMGFRSLSHAQSGPCDLTGGADLSALHLSFRLLFKGSPIGLRLRASNEGLPRPRVARAKETNGLPFPPYTGRGERADGLVSDRARSALSPLLSHGRFPFQGQGWEALGALAERRWVTALAELQRLPQAVVTNVRSHIFAQQVVWQVFVAKRKRSLTGCSKSPSSKAAASEEGRRTLRYVEPLSEVRTPLADFFSILPERSTALCGCECGEPPSPGPPSYTGHFSSFHAISQNIHS